MKLVMNSMLILLIVLLSVSCSQSSEPEAEPVPEPVLEPEPKEETEPESPQQGAEFPSSELWGDRVQYQAFDTAAVNKVDKVALGPNGQICYIHREAGIDDITVVMSNWSSRVNCIDANHDAILSHKRVGNGILKDVLFTDDGSIVIAELIDIENDDETDLFFLQLSIYSVDGSLIKQSILEDKASEDELYYYTVDADDVTRSTLTKLAVGAIPAIVGNAPVTLKWHNGFFYLLTYSYGVKVYKFDRALEVQWSQQVMPAYTWLWASSLSNKAKFTINNYDEIFVGFELFNEDVKVYEQHFNRSFNKPIENKDIAVSVFSTDGEYQRSYLTGKQDSENLVGLVYKDNRLNIAANVRIAKPEATNSTTEWDMLLMSVSPDDGWMDEYQLIHIDKEDSAQDVALLPNGNILFAGTTGFVQVDTNSQVTNGNGLLVEVDESGGIVRSLIMSAPRNVIVEAAVPIDDHQILFASRYDGPITHTCDNDNSGCYTKSALGIAELE